MQNVTHKTLHLSITTGDISGLSTQASTIIPPLETAYQSAVRKKLSVNSVHNNREAFALTTDFQAAKVKGGTSTQIHI